MDALELMNHRKFNKMEKIDKPIVNPLLVFREEFDDWAILFDPDTGDGFGLNPISVFIWKRLDGKHTIQDILKELCENCEGMPENAEQEITDFIKELLEKGYAGYEAKQAP
jgi:SynChlorMet cassette protein ScmD